MSAHIMSGGEYAKRLDDIRALARDARSVVGAGITFGETALQALKDDRTAILTEHAFKCGLLASAADLANTWAREIGLSEIESPDQIKDLIRRLWDRTSARRVDELVSQRNRLTRLLGHAMLCSGRKYWTRVTPPPDAEPCPTCRECIEMIDDCEDMGRQQMESDP